MKPSQGSDWFTRYLHGLCERVHSSTEERCAFIDARTSILGKRRKRRRANYFYYERNIHVYLYIKNQSIGGSRHNTSTAIRATISMLGLVTLSIVSDHEVSTIELKYKGTFQHNKELKD